MSDEKQQSASSEEIEALYQSFKPWLISHARLSNPANAEDAVQTAFAALADRTQKPPPVKNPAAS